MALPKPNVKRQARLSGVWLIPVLALVLVTYLIYKDYSEQGIPIKVFFLDANGIVAGKTQVKYRGMQVGLVKRVSLLKDGSGVYAHVDMIPSAELYLTEDLSFWLVKLRAGIGGIEGMETLISGSYIQVDGPEDPSEKTADTFIALLSPPPAKIPEILVTYKLVAKDAGNIGPGAGIYHRKMLVGEVYDTQLSDDQQSVEITLALQPKYRKLVKEDSRFWSVSGVKASFGLDGVNIESTNLSSIVLGGIAFNSPEESSIAHEGETFPFYNNLADAQKAVEIQLNVPSHLNVSVGNPIYFQERKVGSVTHLEWSQTFTSLTVHARVDIEMAPLLNSQTYFWLDTPKIDFNSLDVGRLIRGNVFKFKPGEGEPLREFDVAMVPPGIDHSAPGLHVKLSTDDVTGLEKNAPIVFAGQTIGRIDSITMNASTKQFLLHGIIRTEFEQLVTGNALFYNASSIDFNVGFNGISAKIPQAKQLFTGAISLYAPMKNTQLKMVSQVKDGVQFNLYHSLESALATMQVQPLTIMLSSAEFHSPTVGASVNFKNFKIGEVTNIDLDIANKGTTTSLIIYPEYAELIKQQSQFWLNSGIKLDVSLAGIKVEAPPLMNILQGGVSVSSPLDSSPVAALNKNSASDTPNQFTLFESFEKTQAIDPEVTLAISQQTNLKAGAKLVYKQQTIGQVTNVALSDDMSSMLATISIKHNHFNFVAKSGSEFVLIQPSFRLTEIKNPETAILGDYLKVIPGTGDKQIHFENQPITPEAYWDTPGLWITLTAENSHSIKAGTPILYKQIVIGEVVNSDLSKNAQQVEFIVNIKNKYQHLVKDNATFSLSSGMSMSAGLFKGVDLKIDSIESLLAGGINLNLGEDGTGSPAKSGDIYEIDMQHK